MKNRIAFKYRSGDETTLHRDLSSLRDCQFYAGTRDALNDPFEGRFDRADLDAQVTAISSAAKLLNAQLNDSLDAVSNSINEVLAFVDKCGVFSMSYNPLNELIWAHYGGSHKGFCVGYDVDLITSFEPSRHFCLDVTYGDCTPSVHATDLLNDQTPRKVLQKILGSKSNPWRYEEEVRTVTTPPGLHEHDFRAVKEVYFGLRCPQKTRSAVMEALAGRGIAYKQVVSPHLSYLLTAQGVVDEFASASPYRQRIAPIAEHAILTSYLKAPLKQHAHYLDKVAEIVRRDPYCSVVETVEFSSSRSSPGNPVIYAQFQRAPSKWVTLYFTLPEVDSQYQALGLNDQSMSPQG